MNSSTTLSRRYTLFPIEKQRLYELYKKAVASFWTVEEIDLTTDVTDFDTKLTSDERRYIMYVLAFFAAADGMVNENLALRMLREPGLPEEAYQFYAMQMGVEAIHSESYSILIETLVARKSRAEADQLFRSIETMPVIGKKAQWAQRWIENSSATFLERLVAFACVEGIFFSGSFCAIFWLKKRGLMPGLCFSNELISRDEGLHCDFACALYHETKEKLSKEIILSIVEDAVAIEKEFVSEALSVALLGMNATLMCEYIEFCADRLCVELIGQKQYNTHNPFPWMELISIQGKTNFFERRVSEYAKHTKSLQQNDSSSNSFQRDEDF